MSIRYGAWVSCVPRCLTIEYIRKAGQPVHAVYPECIDTPVHTERALERPKAKPGTNLNSPQKPGFPPRTNLKMSPILKVFRTQCPISPGPILTARRLRPGRPDLTKCSRQSAPLANFRTNLDFPAKTLFFGLGRT